MINDKFTGIDNAGYLLIRDVLLIKWNAIGGRVSTGTGIKTLEIATCDKPALPATIDFPLTFPSSSTTWTPLLENEMAANEQILF